MLSLCVLTCDGYLELEEAEAILAGFTGAITHLLKFDYLSLLLTVRSIHSFACFSCVCKKKWDFRRG